MSAHPRQAPRRTTGALAVGDAARIGMLRGASLLARTVAPTLGPSGRSVLVARPQGSPLATRGGYRIALELDLAESLPQMGVRALRELGWRMFDSHGDGTATAIVLAERLLRGIVGASAGGLETAALAEAMQALLCQSLEAIERLRRPAESCEMLVGIATSAAYGDEVIGRIVGEAWFEVGREGRVIVEEAHGLEDEIEVRKGMHFGEGWLSPAFVTDQARETAEFDEPYILVAAGRVSELGAITPALRAFASTGKPLVIIAEEIVGEALATLVVNRQRADLKVAAVKAPGAGRWKRSMLEDVAVATGATLIGDEQGSRLEDLRPSMVGRAQRIVISRVGTTIIRGEAEAARVAARCHAIRSDIERARHLGFDREQHCLRLARLSSGVALLRFGAATVAALAARKEIAAAATAATGAAMRGGAAPGGGAALIEAARRLPVGGRLEQVAARRILASALAAPTETIANNCGRDGGSIAARLLAGRGDPWIGYDARQDRVHCLATAGVMDPLPVIESALRGAMSTGLGFGGVAAAWSRSAYAL